MTSQIQNREERATISLLNLSLCRIWYLYYQLKRINSSIHTLGRLSRVKSFGHQRLRTGQTSYCCMLKLLQHQMMNALSFIVRQYNFLLNQMMPDKSHINNITFYIFELNLIDWEAFDKKHCYRRTGKIIPLKYYNIATADNAWQWLVIHQMWTAEFCRTLILTWNCSVYLIIIQCMYQ
jgi:hypothetical protein